MPAAEDSQALLRVDNTWYSSNVTVSPRELPAPLLGEAAGSGALQRFSASNGDTYLAVGVPVGTGGIFVETFAFSALDTALTILGWVLIGASIMAFLVGGIVGRAAGNRLLRPRATLPMGAPSPRAIFRPACR